MRPSAGIRSVRIAILGIALLAPTAAAQDAREGYVSVDDGTRLYYRTVGDGGSVVVIPMAAYLADLLAPLADGRTLVFYDPRNRGRSDAADLSTISLERQIADLEQLRAALGIERMAIVGWSGLGMEMAAYTILHPERVTRLVQVSAVPPSADLMARHSDQRGLRVDREAVDAVEALAASGEIDPAEHCRRLRALSLPASFVDASLIDRVPDVCVHENEWPDRLRPYFAALLSSILDYDWVPDLATLKVPRLVVHGREDGIPLEGARPWAEGVPNARLVVLSPAGHYPFVERAAEFFPVVDRFLEGQWPDEVVEPASRDPSPTS